MNTINIPEDFISKAIYKDKLKGFMAFRATAVIRLQVNANKFQAGRLLLHFLPQEQIIDMAHTRCANIVPITQQPKVELDLACDTEAILEIPYVSPTTHYNLTDGTGPWGVVYLSSYVALLAGTGSNTCEYTIWGSFKDIELVAPTVPEIWEPQAGGRSRRPKAPANIEAMSAGAGPISSIFGAVAKISSSLTAVPGLSSIARPVAWAANATAAAASAFGWSKPIDSSSYMRNKPFMLPFSQNCNGIDVGANLGMFADNEVEVLPSFAGTDQDEMAIAYLTSVPYYLDRTNWSTTNAPGDELFRYDVSPSALYDTSASLTWGGPLWYLSNYFCYWRGPIRFTFKFVKTPFHSGRVLLSYAPGNITSVTLDQTSYLHREIIDVREGSEFTFEVPYVSSTLYKRISEKTGLLTLHVLNTLVCPSTVSSSIVVLLEVSAGEGFEFAVPRSHPAVAPVALAATSGAQQQGEGGEPLEQGEVWEAQAGGALVESENACKISDIVTDIGNATQIGHPLAASAFCVGERVTSILQMMKRATRCTTTSTTSNMNTFRPFTLSVRIDSAPTNHIFGVFDWLSIFGCMYAYNRGSVRIKCDENIAGQYIVRLYTDSSDTTSFSNGGSFQNNFVPPVPFHPAGDSMVEVQVPHYNQLHSRLNIIAIPGKTVPADMYTGRVVVNINRDNTTVARLLRAAGEDFQFGYFVGCLPMRSL